MRRIVDLVLSLSEPVLMFVQWKSMLRQTKTFLTSAGIHVLLLDGNSSQRASMLEDFLSSGVLLLCLEDSFAGLHLPHVRNVIFAHAIVGDRAHVDRLEGQAIARCRRYGQTETVHIHSFVVTDSEEESLWKRTHDSSPPVSTSPSCETN
jgi:SNF2 family DNA or RNA helicase